MSIEKNYYVITGYDLSKYVTDKYEDWRWTPEGEEFLCYQSKGNIQIFDDPMDSSYLYLGYILAEGDEYYFETSKMNPVMILSESIQNKVIKKMHKLINIGVITTEAYAADYQLIVFEECT